jgi:Tol biopolymer transport system component
MRKHSALETSTAAVIVFLICASPAHATYPGRNGLIAFTAQANPEAPYQVYTIRPNGKNLRQLTYLDAGATTPDWSPDGRRITFQIDRNEAPFCSVAIMNSDGTNIIELDLAVRMLAILLDKLWVFPVLNPARVTSMIVQFFGTAGPSLI